MAAMIRRSFGVRKNAWILLVKKGFIQKKKRTRCGHGKGGKEGTFAVKPLGNKGGDGLVEAFSVDRKSEG